MISGQNGHVSLDPSRAGRMPHPALERSCARLRAVVILAGTVRAGVLRQAVDRSLLDLPITAADTVVSLWHSQVESLAEALGVDQLPIRYVLAQASLPPTLPPQSGRVRAVVERDVREFRGTGGVLRDAAIAYDPDDVILVANGAQVLLEPLPGLAADLCEAGGSVSFVGHRDGTPCGLFMIRCGALTGIRDIGFLDFKEQVLPKLGAAGHSVRAVLRKSATATSVRTLDGYLSAVRTFARVAAGLSRDRDPFAEDWRPTFSLIEPGATVHPTATVHDSVVLKGARIEERALVVRSVIGSGATVRASDTVADQSVGRMGELTEEGQR